MRPIRFAAAMALSILPVASLAEDQLSVKLIARLAGPKIAAGYHIAFSPDSKRLAVVHDKNQLTVYEVTDGKALASFQVPLDYVRAIGFSADSANVATASLDAGGLTEVRFWNIATAKETHRFQTSSHVASFSPNLRLLAIGTARYDGPKYRYVVQLWDIITGLQVHEVDDDLIPIRLTFAADGKTLVGFMENGGGVRTW